MTFGLTLMLSTPIFLKRNAERKQAMPDTKTKYVLLHKEWIDSALKAIEDSDGDAALTLLANVLVMPRKPQLRKDGTVSISTLGMSLRPCSQCAFYTRDHDPIDPGWPMVCKLLHMDMLEPYATCWFGEPKRNTSNP